MDYAADYAAGMDRLKRALAENDHEWLSKNYPGAWPWPVSGRLIKRVEIRIGAGGGNASITAETHAQQGKEVVGGGDAQPFDADAHDAFMKGLG